MRTPSQETGTLSETWVREFPLFRDLPPERLARLGQLLTMRHYPAGSRIYRYNDPGATMAFLCKGTVEFSTTDATGTSISFDRNEPGVVFGEVAVLHDGRRSADATARSEVFVLELHRDHLDAVWKEFPEVSAFLLRGMAQRLSRSGGDLRATVTSIRAGAAQKRTAQENRLRHIVEAVGSLAFLYVNGAVIVLWAAFHLLAPHRLRFDDYPFAFLGLLLSIEALIISTLVLKNQSHEAEEAQEREETHDRVNREILQRLDDLTAEVRLANRS